MMRKNAAAAAAAYLNMAYIVFTSALKAINEVSDTVFVIEKNIPFSSYTNEHHDTLHGPCEQWLSEQLTK